MSLATQISDTVINNAESLLKQALTYADEAIKQSESIDVNALQVHVGNPLFNNINLLQFNPSADLRADFLDKFNMEVNTLVPLLKDSFNSFTQSYFPGMNHWNDVYQKLYNDITSGSIGIPLDVEQQTWDRARTRTLQDAKRIRMEAYKESASRGFSIPPGVIQSRILEASNTAFKATSALNAEIAIDSANKRIEYLKFAIPQIIEMEIKAKTLAMDYIKDVISSHSVATDFAKSYIQSYQIFYQTLVSYYDSIIKVEQIKSNVAIESARLQIDAQKAGITAQIGAAEVKAKGAIAACNATASMASSALSGLNALGSEVNTSTSTA